MKQNIDDKEEKEKIKDVWVFKKTLFELQDTPEAWILRGKIEA